MVWALRIASLVGLVVFKRWRHLFTFVGLLVVVDGLTVALIDAIGRPRPMGVEIIGDWRGPSLPSIAVTTFALTAISAAYCFAPAGATRRRAAWAAGVAIGALCLSRVYLGASHPLDVAFGVLLAASFAIPAFRFFASDEVEPISYRGGNAAHVDLGGARGEAESKGGVYKGKHGVPAVADFGFSEVSASDYDGLLVPGGWAPDKLRRFPECLALVRAMDRAGKPIGQICHAGWVLASAGILKGRKLNPGTYPMADISETAVIKDLADQYKPTEFTHRKHVEALLKEMKGNPLAEYFHHDPGTMCQGCHHHSPPAKNPPACISCHAAQWLQPRGDNRPAADYLPDHRAARQSKPGSLEHSRKGFQCRSYTRSPVRCSNTPNNWLTPMVTAPATVRSAIPNTR